MGLPWSSPEYGKLEVVTSWCCCMGTLKSSSCGSNIISFLNEASQTSRDIISEGAGPGHDGAAWDEGWCGVDKGWDMWDGDLWDMNLVSSHVSSEMTCKVSSRDLLVRKTVGTHDDVDIWSSSSKGC